VRLPADGLQVMLNRCGAGSGASKQLLLIAGYILKLKICHRCK
jgi:hypothetical protein